jgi:hypothetical protein
MSAEQLQYYNQLPADLEIRGRYIEICEYYIYHGVEISGSDIEDAIEFESFGGTETAIDYIDQLYFGEHGYHRLLDGRKMELEYMNLPLAPSDEGIVYDDDEEIEYE